MVSSAAPELQGDPACSRRRSWPEPGYSQLRHHSSHAQLLLQPRSLVSLDTVGISSRYLLQSHRYCLHFFCREYFWNVLSVHWRQTAAVLQCCSACSSLDLTTIRRNAAMQACSSLYYFTGMIWQLYMSLHVQILQHYDHPLQHCRNGSIQPE